MAHLARPSPVVGEGEDGLPKVRPVSGVLHIEPPLQLDVEVLSRVSEQSLKLTLGRTLRGWAGRREPDHRRRRLNQAR